MNHFNLSKEAASVSATSDDVIGSSNLPYDWAMVVAQL